jgi:Fe-S-cluster containining protein
LLWKFLFIIKNKPIGFTLLLFFMVNIIAAVWAVFMCRGRFPSGQRGQTVNLLAHAFEGSNPSLPIPLPVFERFKKILYFILAVRVETLKNHPLFSFAFYEKSGLHFKCQRCSGCCRHSPGFVFLSFEDLDHLLAATGLTLPEFRKSYVRVVLIGRFARLSLVEKANYDCIFWENGGCLVYDHRPLQCRSFPFWSSLLSSEGVWEEHKKSCSGIGQGPVHPGDEIEVWLHLRLAERLVEIDSARPDDFEKSFADYLENRK